MIGSDLPGQADEPMVDPSDRLVEKRQRGLTGEQCPRRRQIVEPDGHGRGLRVLHGRAPGNLGHGGQSQGTGMHTAAHRDVDGELGVEGQSAYACTRRWSAEGRPHSPLRMRPPA